MNLLIDALRWIADPEQWTGPNPLHTLLLEHLGWTLLAAAIATVIAAPIGLAIGHTGKGRQWAIGISGAARAIPSFGLLVFLVIVLGVLHKPEAATMTFVALALPPILAGAYSGLESVDRDVVDAARAVGMSEWQVLLRVEIPLALPLIVAGMRSAVLQIVATVTIAAYINLGGLGLPIITGLALRNYDMVLGGAILVAALALVLDALLGLAQRAARPRGLSARRTSATRGGRGSSPDDDAAPGTTFGTTPTTPPDVVARPTGRGD
ncbi:Glycine betaine ABC transport system permease protein [Actinomycetales bacterium JB111]|nr:Glycine betaine ABC transport system permease protein [Actinomycetales bacterium JB111]